jgi:hypothetical protein
MKDCAFSIKDRRVIPMSEEVEKNKVYFGISTALAVAIERGTVDAAEVERTIIAGKDPEKLVPAKKEAKKVAPESVNAPEPPPPAKKEAKKVAPESVNAPEPPPPANPPPAIVPGYSTVPPGIAGMTFVELRSFASQNGIAFNSSDNKVTLVEKISQYVAGKDAAAIAAAANAGEKEEG